MKLFEYAIIHNPKASKEDRDAGRNPKSKLVVDVTRVLAEDDSQVQILAGRAIPEEYLDKLDQIVIAVRPF